MNYLLIFLGLIILCGIGRGLYVRARVNASRPARLSKRERRARNRKGSTAQW